MTDAFLKGVAISLLLIFSVGPIVFMVIKQSINYGRSGGFTFVAGVWFSDIMWIVLSMGFSEVVKTLMNFKIPIGIAGCCLLIGMGIYFVFFKKIQPRRIDMPIEIFGEKLATLSSAKPNYFSIFSSGFILNTLNPAVISFWVVMAASLSAVYSFQHQMVVFGTCLAINMLADIGKVMGAGYIGKKLSDKNILLINRISGLLYLAFGVILLVGIGVAVFND
jgi:threonine/homoserine/homoserine lactone efflux protein